MIISVFDSLPVPDTISSRLFVNYIKEYLCSDGDYRDLVMSMFSNPEADFYLFLRGGDSDNKAILHRLEQYGVLSQKSEYHFYKYPETKDSFIKIREPSNDKLKSIQAQSEVYFRSKIFLSQRVIDHLNNQELIDMKDSIKPELFEMKPSFWGFSVNLKELLKRGRRFWKQRKK